MRYVLISVLVLVGLAGASGVQQEPVRVVPQSSQQVKLSYAPVVENAAPAVVNIYTKRIVKSRQSALFNDPIFRRFFGDSFSFGMPQERVQGSLGSGVIVRPDGVIVTNNHVIEGADEITVVLADRREFEASVILADERTDLAILQIDPTGERLPVLPFANSDDVLVGDIVLAIGNPFGVGQTVTSGIVSASARTQRGINDFGFFIQTDAAVNPGNSGGALIGIDGRLLGINTAIYSRTGASNGIGFAIPANMVQSVVRAALDEGVLARPWLGVSLQSVTTELARGLGLDRAGGVLINNIFAGGPADKTDLGPGDVILAIDGREIVDEAELRFRTATHKPGDEISLTVLKEGLLVERTLELDLPPEVPDRDITVLDGRHPFQGVTIANLNPRFNDELQIDLFRTGVIVLDIDRQTPAARFQFLVRGDQVLQINGVNVDTVDDMESVLGSPSEQYVYTIARRGQLQECTIIPNRSKSCRRVS